MKNIYLINTCPIKCQGNILIETSEKLTTIATKLPKITRNIYKSPLERGASLEAGCVSPLMWEQRCIT